MHGKIISDTYIKYEDEKQKMRMGGGSWSVKLDELIGDVKEIVYVTIEGRYKIRMDIAIARGFERSFNTKNGLENKLIVPIKFWDFEEYNKEIITEISNLNPKALAQAKKDLQKAKEAKGTWKDKALAGDPVPESRMSPEQRGGIREMMAARSGDYSGLGPHRGMPLSAQDRQTYLAELLENDPASSLYDLSTVKDFSEEENPFRKDRMSRGVEGYYSDDTAYVKDLNKLGTRVGPFKGGEFDKQLASVASHELTHPNVEKYDIDMSNIEDPR